MRIMQNGQPEDSSMPLFTGIGVALVALFDEKGALLARETADLAARGR
jgi:hypothetical protein